METREARSAEEQIREVGLRCTEPRTLVLKCLIRSKNPLSIDDLAKRLKGRVHPVTVYRILREFVKHNLVYQTDFQTGKAYFEFQNTHHHHIVCTDCGATEEITPPDADQVLLKAARSQTTFPTVSHHTLEFFGQCKKCTKARG